MVLSDFGGARLDTLSLGGELPVLSDGVPVDVPEGKDRALYGVSRSQANIQVNLLQGSEGRTNKAVGEVLYDFQTMKLNAATGEVAFRGKAPGSNRLTFIRPNASGSQTEGFQLPENMGIVNTIAVIDGEGYVASGWGRNGTLSVFGADGNLKSSVMTGELEFPKRHILKWTARDTSIPQEWRDHGIRCQQATGRAVRRAGRRWSFVLRVERPN